MARKKKEENINNEATMNQEQATNTGKGKKTKNPKIPVTNVTSEDKERASEILGTEAKVNLEGFAKLSKDIKHSLVSCSINDIRFCVQAYYQMQEIRIGLGGQIRSIEQGKSASYLASDNGEFHADLLQWLYNNMLGLENEIKKALDVWGDSNPVASWAKSVCGIGPVISAGLVAYFDITRAPSASHFYSYCGLNDNNDPWLGKEKAKALVDKYCKGPLVTVDELTALALDDNCSRSMEKLLRYAYDTKKDKYTKEALIKGLSKPPYNEELKVLIWKIGQSFVKVSGKPKSLYGRIYKEKKAIEEVKNAKKQFKDQAARKLETTKIGKSTDAYKSYIIGELPPAHIQARAERYATKIFVSHLWEEMYRLQYNSEAPRPYAIAHLGHVDIIKPEVPYTPLDPNKPATQPANPVVYH